MILLGLTGSVATVLYEKMIAQLREIDEHVEVVMTQRALPFFKPNSDILNIADAVYSDANEWRWEAGKSPYRDYWLKDDPVLHITLRDRADMLVIAPMSANTMGKIANGLCDNLLTSVVRAWDMNKPIYMCPAMNTKMWEHPVTETHIHQLKEWGYDIIPPQEKLLACGDVGMGAMANIDDIIRTIKFDVDVIWNFPLRKCNGVPIDPHPGAFGYERKGSRHTGVDLYTSDRQSVYAVEEGEVVCIEKFTGAGDNSPWWNETDCVLVEGKTGVVCYGEITPHKKLEVGDKVKEGQKIGNVKRVIQKGKERYEIKGWSPSMLHLELYPHGTVKPSEGFEDHLRDPTPYLIKVFNKPLIYPHYSPS